MPADALVLLSHRIRSVFRDLAQEKGKKVPGYAWHIDLRETVFQLPVRLYFGGVHNGINKIQFIDVAHLGLTRTREIVRAICGDLDAVRIARLDCCVDIDIPLLDLALYCRLALVQNCTIVRSRTGTTFYLRHSYPRKAMMYDKLRQLEFAGDPTIKAYVWEGPLTRVEVQLRSSGLPFRRFIDLERYAKLDMLPNLSFWEVGRKRDGLTAIGNGVGERGNSYGWYVGRPSPPRSRREASLDDCRGRSTARRKGSDALSLGLSKAGSSPQDWPFCTVYGIGFGRIR